jgi:DNA-binding response OmpR family regulator
VAKGELNLAAQRGHILEAAMDNYLSKPMRIETEYAQVQVALERSFVETTK